MIYTVFGIIHSFVRGKNVNWCEWCRLIWDLLYRR